MDDKKIEHIVMTPKCKTANSTVIAIERQLFDLPTSNGNAEHVHIAGGDHKGIVINKQAVLVSNGETDPAELSLQFKVFLVSSQTGKHTKESRTLQFWFAKNIPEPDHASIAQEFFRELVTPQEFPRDYVGFIKKIMKLMQYKYKALQKLEVELKQLEEPLTMPTRPSKTGRVAFALHQLEKRIWDSVSTDETTLGQNVELTLEKVLEVIESAYPNPVTISDLVRDYGWDESAIETNLKELQKKGVVKAMDKGAFTRVVHHDVDVQVVKQMPTMAKAKQPTIAIITAQYCEKLAVDAMMTNKETFVRYTTIGESNVYTLGNIGTHRIVCTKLPTVGHTREALTAAGNTTTRLLGTFQKVDYVFLVGVGGGVPHYTDYNKHVRLGDVVVSYPAPQNKPYIYLYCESAKLHESGNYQFETKEYSPSNSGLQDIAASINTQVNEGLITPPWKLYIEEGLKILESQTEHVFEAPPPESDKLYMAIGDKELIEVEHPTLSQKSNKRLDGCPRIHLAPVGSGRRISRDDQLRQKFANQFGVLSYDTEMDAVVESILGNCRDTFIVIRGISDYKDGSRIKEWQPYASLAAASVCKSIICAMDPPNSD